MVQELSRVAFFFLRHGETDWNAQGLSQGRTDVALNAVGLMQAHTAARRLARHGIVAIVSSPLQRAQQTASIVGSVLELDCATDPDLQETSFGEQEGRKMGPWYDDWVAESYTPAGGETFADLRARATRAMNRTLARPGPVLVVAHGGVFRAVRAQMGLSPLVRTENGAPLHCVPGDPWSLNPVE